MKSSTVTPSATAKVIAMPLRLRFLQAFITEHGPRCDWPGCLDHARAFYDRPDHSGLALCARHIRELSEAGQIDTAENSLYAPHVPVFSATEEAEKFSEALTSCLRKSLKPRKTRKMGGN